MCSTRRLRDKKVFGGQTLINPAYVFLESSLTRSVRTDIVLQWRQPLSFMKFRC
jgi:hypothetical protein